MMGSSPSEGVKLVDFGLSRTISQDTELTQIMGTPDYVGKCFDEDNYHFIKHLTSFFICNKVLPIK